MNDTPYTPKFSVGDIIILVDILGQTFDNEEDYRQAIRQKSALIVNIGEEPFVHYEMSFPFSTTDTKAMIVRSCGFIDKYYNRLNNDD